MRAELDVHHAEAESTLHRMIALQEEVNRHSYALYDVTDDDFRAVAELYTGRPDVSMDKLVADLIASESVPFLAGLRYRPSGLRKRADWGQTWERQREEDRIDARVAAALTREGRETDEKHASGAPGARRQREVGDNPPPPQYRTPNFVDTTEWRLCGPLDVPKERLVGYPHCTPDDETGLVVGWAGRDHREQAIALVSHLHAQIADASNYTGGVSAAMSIGAHDSVVDLARNHSRVSVSALYTEQLFKPRDISVR